MVASSVVIAEPLTGDEAGGQPEGLDDPKSSGTRSCSRLFQHRQIMAKYAPGDDPNELLLQIGNGEA